MNNAATITLYISDEYFSDSLGADYSVEAIDEIRALGYKAKIVFGAAEDVWEASTDIGEEARAKVSAALERALCSASESLDPWAI